MSSSGRNRVVFVVDDERLIASTLQLILKRRGFDARSFVDPVTALQAAQLTAPDLLLSDVMMPGMNGIELAIQVTRGCADCKVLLFSGQTATNDLLMDARSRGHHFEILAKPVHPSELLAKIDEMFAA
jgi:DNA-binding response OmpR family regulator